MSEQEKVAQALKAGIEAARQGKTETARRLLEAVVARDDRNELAWIWLATVMSSPEERRICLEKVLEINPENARARQALQSLVKSTTSEQAAVQSEVGGRNPLLNLLGTLAVMVVMVLLILLAFQGLDVEPQLPPTDLPLTQVAAREAARITPTATPVPTLPIVLVQPEDRITSLPPTFTPTPTETPLPTFTPTATPIPLSEFTVLFTASEPDSLSPGLYQVTGDGENQTRLLEVAQDVAWDFAGERITFVQPVTSASEAPPEDADNPDATTAPEDVPASDDVLTVREVFVAPATNPGSADQVTQLATRDATDPVLSPDGTQVVFVSAFDGTDDDLWLLDLNSGITTQLTINDGIDRDPSWSPDGNRLVFTSDRETPGLTEIYVMSLAASPDPESGYAAIRLTEDAGNSYAPAWSPDGNMIAYLNDSSGYGEVYVMQSTGRGNRLLTLTQGVEHREPGWTPDSRFVAFLSNEGGDIFQLYLTDLRGRDRIRVIDNTLNLESFGFRPVPSLMATGADN